MYIKVRVYAGMKKDSLKEVGNHHFEIVTKVPAQGNAANNRVREVIAEQYKVSAKAVRIISGHHHPSKILEVINGE